MHRQPWLGPTWALDNCRPPGQGQGNKCTSPGPRMGLARDGCGALFGAPPAGPGATRRATPRSA
eukprot:3183660-Pyramimonas_sp.AAC.1